MRSNIDGAIQAIEEVVKTVNNTVEVADWIANNLAVKGADIAQEYFDRAEYDGQNTVKVHSEKRKYGAIIIASGKPVCFIEFGTGVYYNGSGSYPLPLPEGVVGIGEYGKGQGKKDWWVYKGEPGNAGGEPVANRPGYTITHGNIGFHPMYNTSVDLTRMAKDMVNRYIHGRLQ